MDWSRGLKAIKEKMNIIGFCALVLFFWSIILLAPNDTRVEDLEHRTLNEMPELNLQTAMNGGFSKQFEEFIADQVGFRTSFVMLSRNIESAFGAAMRDEPVLVNAGAMTGMAGRDDSDNYTMIEPPASVAADGNGYSADSPQSGGDSDGGNDGNAGASASTSADGNDAPQPGVDESGQSGGSSNETEPETAETVEPIRAGPVLAFTDKLVELYGYTSGSCTRYAEAVEGYAKALEGKATVYSLIVPTQAEFIDEKYRYMSDSQFDAIKKVYDNLEVARTVDAYSILSIHSNEYVYFRTDHHWTALGAYYAYLAFCDAAGIEPVTIDKYDSHELPGFLGYLFSIHPTDELRENPDTLVYYELKEPLETSNRLLHKPLGDYVTYSIFIGGDNPIYVIETSVKNGKTCAVIKDSYGNAFVPWLAPNYERLIVFDPRKFTGSVVKTLAEYDDVDLIILNSAFGPGSGGFNGLLNNIR